jgi:hypothetical protein
VDDNDSSDKETFRRERKCLNEKCGDTNVDQVVNVEEQQVKKNQTRRLSPGGKYNASSSSSSSYT